MMRNESARLSNSFLTLQNKMAVTIKEVKNKQQWEDFVMSVHPNQFLQSWNSGEQYEILGNKIFRVGIYENELLKGVCFLIKFIAKRGTYLFAPYGPLIDTMSLFSELITYLKELAKSEEADFIRINPFLQDTEENTQVFRENGFIPAPMHTIAEVLWMLDLIQSEEDILKNMRKNTRYSIRKAEKDGVKVIKSTDINDVKKFNDIYAETAKRHNFVPYSFDLLKAQVKSFKDDNEVMIYFAEYNNEIISSAIVMYFGDQASYHHGASSSKYGNITDSYLVQWEAIKEAKKRGCKIYNFWGIVENEPKHPFAGISLFKKGFGGYRYDLMHCQDLAITKKYYLTRFFEKIRKFKRGF